jgi:methionyl-tRNA formyltransferase
MTLRLVFMGTPEFAVPTLTELIAAGHDIVAVYTQPPRPAGRGMAPSPSPVQKAAEAAGLPVRSPLSFKDAADREAFAALEADAAVVVAYGLILPQAVLAATRLGAYNLHASALPRWRGAAPIQRSIMAGDAATAAMVMRMEAGLDTGPVCLAEHVAILPDETAGELHDRLAPIGAGLMVRALAALERGALTETPQPAEGVTYAAKIDKAEARIDFAKPEREVHNLIRGLSPFPGAWFEMVHGEARERIKVLGATLADGHDAPGTILDDRLTIACGNGAVRLTRLQRAGKKPTSAAELLRGFAIPPGTRLA